MGERKLTSLALAGEMVAWFGASHTALLLGWCAMASAYGAQDAAGFLAMPVGGESTRYKRLADLRDLAARLRAKGYELNADEDPVLALARVAIVPM